MHLDNKVLIRTMVIQLFKSSKWCYSHGCSHLGKLFDNLIKLTCAADISGRTSIGKNISFSHFGMGIIIHPDAVIGDNCIINAKVTIGNRYPHPGAPIIGDNVYIGIGAYVGGSVKIGDNVRIGAMSVVLNDVPSNCTVVGNPARIIKNDKG